MSIHPTAIVEDGARLDGGVDIGPYCVVSSGARLGEGVRLISHVTIAGITEIGPRSAVYPNAALGGGAQIRNADAPEAQLVIGADTVVRESVTISAGSRRGGGITRIGDRAYLMALSHVGHDCQLGDEVTLSNGVQLGGHVHVGDGVIMGGLAAAQQFSRIGQYAFVSGGSGVTADIIPYGMARGLQARIAGLNLVGLRRRGIPHANIHILRAAFRAIFLDSDGSLNDRARRAKETWPDVAEVQHVTDFILSAAKRKISPARAGAAIGDGDA